MIDNQYMQNNGQDTEQEKTLGELLIPYLVQWKWIVASVVLFIVVAFVYLRYSTPVYQVTSKVLIKDEKRGQSPADMDIFKDLGIMSSSGNVENEIEILRSRALQRRVADSLHTDISYFTKGRIKRSEVYKTSPIEVVAYEDNGYKGYWKVELNPEGNFNILVEESDSSFVAAPGELFDSPAGPAYINLTGQQTEFPVWVRFEKWNQDNKAISINSLSKTSGVVDLSMTSSCPPKSEDILNTLIYFYNLGALEDKRWVTEQTIRFIDDRLKYIAIDLEDVEKDVEAYKKEKQLTDLQAEAGLYLTSGSEYEKKIAEISLQKGILYSIEEYIQEDSNKFSAIPTNIGITDVSLLSMVEEFNKMQLSRRQAMVSMTPENPIIIELDKQLASLRNDILKAIKNAEKDYEYTLADLQRKEDVYMSRIRHLSTNEREFRGYARQQELTESIYLYLLQKREESAITLSMVSPNAKIIDPAFTNPIPVRPRKSIIMLLALVLGVMVPVGIIYLIEILNNKIKTKEDLEKLTNAPVLGIVPERTSSSDIRVKDDSRSGEVEMYRLLSTNLEFMLTDKTQKVIMVTSSVPSEGKSSFSLNLALTWATVGKGCFSSTSICEIRG